MQPAESPAALPTRRGRFAPSPTGPLHFGSLVAALASYLHTKHQHGQWLVRIEDIDPPREVAGAAKQILSTLEAFGFDWDQTETYQSQRVAVHQAALDRLIASGEVYACECTRKSIRAAGGVYRGICRDKQLPLDQHWALRLRQTAEYPSLDDGILGRVTSIDNYDEDFIVRRRDGYWAYHLAVVADDIEQEIDHVVRGSDILSSTPKHRRIYQCLGATEPSYFHIPIVLGPDGRKLAKQTYAPSLEVSEASEQLVQALAFLGQNIDPAMAASQPDEILQWAIPKWSVNAVPKRMASAWPV